MVAAAFVRLIAVEEITFAQKLRRTDWVGAVLFIGGRTSLLVGLSWDGIQYPWRSAVTLVPIIVGLCCLVVSGWWQHYAKPHSLLPMSVFYNWSAVAAFYCTLVNGLVSTPQDFVTKDVLTTPSYSPVYTIPCSS
jgi:hypothetical protein